MIGHRRQRRGWTIDDSTPRLDHRSLRTDGSDRLAGEEWPKPGEEGTPGSSFREGRARRPLRYSGSDAGNETRRHQKGGKKNERVRERCRMKLRSDRSDSSEDVDSLRSPIGSKHPTWKEKRSRPLQCSKSANRRPLFPPKESSETEAASDQGHVEELTEHRVKKRQKQIDFGKNTLAYDRYIKSIPKSARTKDDPVTPDKMALCSKRAFDGRVRQWRVKLHAWDPPKIGALESDTLNDKETEEEEFDPLSMKFTGWESLSDGIKKLEEDKENDSQTDGNSTKKEDDELSEIDWDADMPMSDWSLLLGDN